MDKEKGVLVIPHVRPEDEGKYACVANTSWHPVEVSTPASLRVISKLKQNNTIKPIALTLIFVKRESSVLALIQKRVAIE